MAEKQPLLTGIRVIDCGTFILGPAAATVMSDFGAEVIKIEAPGIGDPNRYLHTITPMPKCDRDYCWQLDSRNKKSVVLDLRKPEGRDILLELVKTADVFLTNFPTSVLENLKITDGDLRPLNERLIYARATGYGEKGPDVEQPGYDMTAWWARSGLMDVIRSADNEPALSVGGMGDHPSSLALYAAIMMALYDRERTGKGTKVSTSLVANGIWSNSLFIQGALCGAEPYTYPSRSEAPNALVNHYVTRDGKRFILCGIRADKDWVAVCRSIGREDLLEEERFATAEGRYAHAAELVAIFDAAFVQRDFDEWRALFIEHDLTCSPVMQFADVPNDPGVRANGVIVEFEHPTYGPMRTVDNPITVDSSPKVTPAAAPTLGQHTAAVLRGLGYSDADIRVLEEHGVVSTGDE